MAVNKSNGSPEDILVGGQAVIEGVMMRTPHALAVAVRCGDGSIEVIKEPIKRLADCWRPFSWPIVRGFAVLVQSLILGIRALNYSVNISMKSTESAAGEEKKNSQAKPTALPIAVSILFGSAAAIVLFVLLPLWLASWLKGYFAAVHNWIVFNLVDGVIRLAVFLAYIVSIGFLKDIRRVFQYHGAEHKAVYVWEAGESLVPENARSKSRLHPRCGTSFMMLVMAVSIIVFSFFKFNHFWAIFLSRVILIPLVSGLSYELIRLSARRSSRYSFWWLMVSPGLALQRLTTKEPADDQLEVAIWALKEALELEGVKAVEAKTAA